MPHTQAAASGGTAPVVEAGPERADRLVVDTRGLPSAIRFDVWRAFWEPVLHVAAHMAGAEGFRGRARLLRVGHHVVLDAEADAAGYRRARSEGLRDGLDRWVVAMRAPDSDGGPVELLLGSLALGFGVRELGGRWCCVFIQPDRLPQLAPVFATARAVTTPSPATRMLAGMLPRIAEAAADIAPDDAPRLEAALSSMLTACLTGCETLPSSTRQQQEAARRARVMALVDAGLGEPELSPASLVERSGISRSELYRCFAPVGGLARAIQQRRLRHAYRELVRADGPATISRIGEAVGFFDPSTFTRAFRREFGCTPSEILARRPPSAARPVPGLAAVLSLR